MRISSLLISATVLIATAGTSIAGVCVSCTGPNATYLCTVKNADTIESLAGGKALKKICTKVLKRTEQHSSCQILDVPESKCPGVAKTVGWGDVKKAAKSSDDAAAKPVAPPVAAAGPVTPPGAAQPPGNRGPASAEARPSPEQATATPPPVAGASTAPPKAPPTEDEAGLGEKLKGAAENTWKCVSSFFGNC